jgi:hypothetical protein
MFLFWELALAGCRVFEDLSADCFTFVWTVPW